MAMTPQGPQPPDDPAARFRRPAQSQAPQPQGDVSQAPFAGMQVPAPQSPSRQQTLSPTPPRPQAQAPGDPPSSSGPPDLMASLEAGVRCAFQPGEVFCQCRALPAPPYSRMLLAAVFWAAVGGGLSLALAIMRSPVDVGVVPLALSILGVTLAAVPLAFLGAGILHGLAMLAGGQAGFDRSFQIVSLIGVGLPVGAALMQFQVPFIWLAPTLYLTFLSVRAVETMHEAPGAQAWLVVGVFGLLVAAAQGVLHKSAEKFQRKVEHLVNIYATTKPGQAATEPEKPPPAVEEPVRDPRQDWADQIPSQREEGVAGSQVQSRRSSIDMVALPGSQGQEGGLPMMPSAGQALGQPLDGAGLPSRQELGQMQDQTASFISRINQQVQGNPQMLQGMPEEQKAKFQKILNAANQMAGGANKGGANPLADPEIQRLIGEVMKMASQAKAQGGAAPGPRRKKAKARPTQDPLEVESLDE